MAKDKDEAQPEAQPEAEKAAPEATPVQATSPSVEAVEELSKGYKWLQGAYQKQVQTTRILSCISGDVCPVAFCTTECTSFYALHSLVDNCIDPTNTYPEECVLLGDPPAANQHCYGVNPNSLGYYEWEC
ncbi:hypothetical protein LCGC14_3086520 [marine sediment metagenome]|uniref:Uncharacterized protein n=1 Tax=marine sediment metagenome TaxID=412755 RepID=A0A0F8Z2A1_9ZZZZ